MYHFQRFWVTKMMEGMGITLRGRRHRRAQAAFPLTLTLSLRERGKPGGFTVCRKMVPANPAPDLAIRRPMILPLPEGEGRGEGEGSERTAMPPESIEVASEGSTIRIIPAFSGCKDPVGAAAQFLKTL
jgi:hypothetical protein